MTQDERRELLTEIAEIISGLQVPYSIDGRILGTAGSAFLKVWERLHLHGWQGPESIQQALAAALLDDTEVK